MGVGSSKKKEKERLKKEQKEKEEKFQKAKRDIELKIKELEEKLEELKNKAKSFHEQAKTKLQEGDRNGAKYLLNKKKKINEQIDKFNGALIMLDDEFMMMENQEFFGDIKGAISSANEVLKNENKEISTSAVKIENLVSSINDLKKDFQQFGDVLEGMNEDDLDNIDVEEEFEDLTKNVIEEESKAFPESNKEKLEYNKNKKEKNNNDMIEA